MKSALNYEAFIQKGLHGLRLVQHGGGDSFGDGRQRRHAPVKLVANLCRDEGRGGELLLSQQALHVLAQHTVGIERQRPHADQNDRQHTQGDAGLQ